MVRTQVQLTEDQLDRVRRTAARRGVSVSAVVREAVDATLEQQDDGHSWQRALSTVGRFRSGAADVSVEHDRELADAFGG